MQVKNRGWHKLVLQESESIDMRFIKGGAGNMNGEVMGNEARKGDWTDV